MLPFLTPCHYVCRTIWFWNKMNDMLHINTAFVSNSKLQCKANTVTSSAAEMTFTCLEDPRESYPQGLQFLSYPWEEPALLPCSLLADCLPEESLASPHTCTFPPPSRGAIAVMRKLMTIKGEAAWWGETEANNVWLENSNLHGSLPHLTFFAGELRYFQGCFLTLPPLPEQRVFVLVCLWDRKGGEASLGWNGLLGVWASGMKLMLPSFLRWFLGLFHCIFPSGRGISMQQKHQNKCV